MLRLLLDLAAMEMGTDTEEAGAESVDAAAVECTAADDAAAVDAGDCCTRRGSGGGGGAADETGAGAVDDAAAAAARLCGLSACGSTSASGWTVWRGRSGRGGAVLTFDVTTPPLPLPAPNRPPTSAAAFDCIGPESVPPLAVAAEFVRAARTENTHTFCSRPDGCAGRAAAAAGWVGRCAAVGQRQRTAERDATALSLAAS